MRTAPAGTSLLQSHAERDHRDRTHRHHNGNHKALRERQLLELEVEGVLDVDMVASVVTEITSTISVVQQIVIDETGSTVQIETLLAPSTTTELIISEALPTAAPSIIDLATRFTSAPLAPITSIDLQPTSIVDILQSLPTSLASPPTTSIPSPVSNSTGPASSGSSFGSLSNASNSTTSSTIISSSIREFISTLSSTSIELESTTILSTSYATETSDPSELATTTGAAIGTAGRPQPAGTGNINGSPSSTAAAGDSGNSYGSGLAPSTPAVIGGVVGGIAGIAFIVALLMFFVKWRKRQQSLLRLSTGDTATTRAAAVGGSGTEPSHSRGMVEKSLPFSIPAAFAGLTGYKRSSNQTSVGASSTAGSERGFYRVSGRKLPSRNPGEPLPEGYGYGGTHESLSGLSFYQDSQGIYAGPISPTSQRGGTTRDSEISQITAPMRDSGIPIQRPSPARTPVISQGPFVPPSPILPPMDPPRRPDALGRSHPSRDGSRGSRFTEEV